MAPTSTPTAILNSKAGFWRSSGLRGESRLGSGELRRGPRAEFSGIGDRRLDALAGLLLSSLRPSRSVPPFLRLSKLGVAAKDAPPVRVSPVSCNRFREVSSGDPCLFLVGLRLRPFKALSVSNATLQSCPGYSEVLSLDLVPLGDNLWPHRLV